MFVRELMVKYKKRRVSKSSYPCLGETASSSLAVVNLFSKSLSRETVEKFIAVYLNSQNKIESFSVIGIGSLSNAPGSPRDVFKGALLANAASLICIHNHPSGNIKPSREDEELTRDLVEIGKLLDVKFLDHIIIGDGNYHSMADDGFIRRMNKYSAA